MLYGGSMIYPPVHNTYGYHPYYGGGWGCGGCCMGPRERSETAGAILGGITGAIAGAKVSKTIGGAVIGGLVGLIGGALFNREATRPDCWWC